MATGSQVNPNSRIYFPLNRDIMPEYHYSPLSEPNSSRLLLLLPGSESSNDIRGKLLEFNLRRSQLAIRPYEALSYVWGSKDRTESITIVDDRNGDQKLAVTLNLHSALKHLQDTDIPRILWIDSVCIDQSSKVEKECQIPLMTEIYARAWRVIVWLGEASTGSSEALETVRLAAENPVESFNTDALMIKGISELLDRSWFRRIWVLQEVAAAHQILIMCGLRGIDGHTFCLGLENLRMSLDDSISLVTSLMRKAIFRSTQIVEIQGRLQLNISILGDLIDTYHAHEATERHDKIYALLGMSSDAVYVPELQPDYKIPWEKLLQDLVIYLLGAQASVATGKDTETAIIQCKGCILGEVNSVNMQQDNKVDLEVTLRHDLESLKNTESQDIIWSLPSSTKSIKSGDIICLLKGARLPTIIRLHHDCFHIIKITASPPEQIKADISHLARLANQFDRDFLLIWNWERLSETSKTQEKYEYESILLRPEAELASRLSNPTKIWNVALILSDLGYIHDAREWLRDVIMEYKIGLGEKHPHAEESEFVLTPLGLAARNGYMEVIELLLAKGDIAIDSKDFHGRTPLSHAAEYGHEAIVKRLLATGQIDVNSRDWHDRTPLLHSVVNNHVGVAKLLLNSKADVSLEDVDGHSPLSYAIWYEYDAMTQLLPRMDTARNINVPMIMGSERLQSPLARAALYGHENVARRLLKASKSAKADAELENDLCETALSFAATRGHDIIVNLLIKTGMAKVDLENDFGRTPLALAARYGHTRAVYWLLKTKKVNVESKGWSKERTPLALASKRGHEGVVQLLLERGKADVEAGDEYCQTPLSLAAKYGHEAVVKILIEVGKANIESKDKLMHQTPLAWAAYSGHEGIVRLLVERGTADIKSKREYVQEALEIATRKGHQGIIKLLGSLI